MWDYRQASHRILSIFLSLVVLWIGYSYSIDAVSDNNSTVHDVYINLLNYITFIVSAVLISRGLATWILNSYAAGWKYHTFLMFNQAADKYYKKVRNKKRFLNISFIVSLVVTIITGIVTNYLFKYLTGM